MEASKTQVDEALAFIRAMIPTIRAADLADALLRRKLGKAFSITKYAINGEVSLNQILADLLDPGGPHGQGGAFLRPFVEMLPGNIKVEREEEWSAVTNHPTAKRRLVDVALFSNNIAIYIECKPWAAEAQEQLSDYAEDLLARSENKKMMIFVPGQQDRQPLTLAPEFRERLGGSGYVKIAYQRREGQSSIVQWLEQCAALSEAENVRVFINDLKNYLDGKFPEDTGSIPMDSDPFVDMVFGSVRGHEDLTRTVLRLEPVARRLAEDIVNDFVEKLKQKLQNRMGAEWVVTYDKFEFGQTYYSLWLKKKKIGPSYGESVSKIKTAN